MCSWFNSSALQGFWQKNAGLVLVVISQFFGATMNTIARYLEHSEHPMQPFQLLLIRMGITSMFCCLYMWKMRVPHFPFGMPGIRLQLVARALIGFFGITGMYYSLLYLPVAEATVLTFLAPGVAGIVCYILLGEPFTREEKIATFLSLVGVLLIAQPASFLEVSPSLESQGRGQSEDFNSTAISNSTSNPIRDIPKASSSERIYAVGYAMIGVVGSAGAFVTMRSIGKKAHPLISVNYFTTWATFVALVVLTISTFITPSLAPMTGDFRTLVPSSWKQCALLLTMGVAGLLMLTMLTTGLAHEKSNRATNMVYTSMLFALLYDRVIFGETPTFWSWLGSALILGSAMYVAVSKSQGIDVLKRDEAVYHPLSDEEEVAAVEVDDPDELQLEEMPSGSK